MTQALRFVAPDSILTGWDFSTGGVKHLAFDLAGNTVAAVRLPTDLWTEDGVPELNLMQLEGQAGYLTGNFDVVSVSAAASTGLMDLRTNRWQPAMLDALEDVNNRRLVVEQLPRIVDQYDLVGPVSANLALEAGIDPEHRPLLFP